MAHSTCFGLCLGCLTFYSHLVANDRQLFACNDSVLVKSKMGIELDANGADDW